MQQSFVSAHAAPGFVLAAQCRPADEVAGDFLVVTPRGPGRLSVVLGDACGRGREGAALLPALLPRVRELARSELSPRSLLVELNRAALVHLPIDRFVTALAVEIDADLCRLTAANAGQVPLLARSRRGNVRIIGRASGPPLGVANEPLYLEECTPVEAGETLVMMTDGALETLDADLLGMTGLKRLLMSAPLGAQALERSILEALDRAPRPRVQDDVTLLCLEVGHLAANADSQLKHAS